MTSDAYSEASPGELSGHLLVLDDEESVLATAQKMLETLGVTVECVNCGEEAIEAVERAATRRIPSWLDSGSMDSTPSPESRAP